MAEVSRERFARSQRLVRPADYDLVYQCGLKVHSASFVLFGLVNSLDHHRLGLTVSRKIGKAVVRNRIKRLFREIFRKTAATIPNHIDFVVNAKRSCAPAEFEPLREEFLVAVGKWNAEMSRNAGGKIRCAPDPTSQSLP